MKSLVLVETISCIAKDDQERQSIVLV